MTWNVFLYSSGGTWVADGTINRPNADLSVPILTTQQKIQLANGSKSFLTPEIKYVYDQIKFVWIADDSTIKDKIEAYIQNHDKVKIVTHYSGIEFIGRFTSITPIWLIGQEPDEWDIEAIFEMTDE